MSKSNKNVGFMFTWKIKNFNLCYQRSKAYLKSPLFKVEILDKSEWELWLCSIKNNKEVCLALYRSQNDNGPQKVQTDYELFIFKRNCPSLYYEQKGTSFERHHLCFGMSVPTDKIFDEKETFLQDNKLVVGCRLWNANIENLVKCFAVTQISMEKYHISYFFHTHISNLYFNKDEIVLHSVSKKYPNFKISAKQHKNLDLEVHAIEPTFRVFVKCEVSIQQLNCFKKMIFEDGHWFETGAANKVWTLPNIFKSAISDLINSGNEFRKIDINLFASDGSQTSFVESIDYCSSIPESNEMIQASSEYLLPKQFEKIYLVEKFTDYTIKSDKKEFKVHKAIFEAVSPVFAAMFESNMTEIEDSSVTIDDIDWEILEKMVHYVYTGKLIDVEWNDALKLYAAADKYEITDLKQSCTRIIATKMNAENVDDALILADLHQDVMIMNATKQLIRENATQVFGSEKWRSVMESHPKLACEVMHDTLTH